MAVAPRPTSDHPGAAGPATPAATAVPGARAGLVVLAALLALCGLAAALGGARAVPRATWVQTGAALVALGVLAAWVADRRPGAELGLRAPATAAGTEPVPAPAGFVLRAPWAAVGGRGRGRAAGRCSRPSRWPGARRPDRSWEVFNREAAYALVLVAAVAAGSSAPRALPRAAGGVVLVTTLVALWALAGDRRAGCHPGGPGRRPRLAPARAAADLHRPRRARSARSPPWPSASPRAACPAARRGCSRSPPRRCCSWRSG